MFKPVSNIIRTKICKDVIKNLENRTSKSIFEFEKSSAANNYHPVPIIFSKAQGIKVRDLDGKDYYDFLSGYGVVSQGHIHPRVLKVAYEQMQKCTLSARAFHSDIFGIYADFITKFFGYDKVLPMNTGAEAVESALKVSRMWGYKVKKIPDNKAIIVCAENNFHGRTIACISLSNDPTSYGGFGPLVPGIMRVKYGSVEELEKIFIKHGKNICSFIVEPIQGEAGVIIPPDNYFKEVRKLCTKHNILFIADEVQSGLGRTGKMLAIDHYDVRPDMIILAKALSAGFLPVSAILADKEVLDVLTPGIHGSTFGGNPLACAVAIEALKVLHEENLPMKSAVQGKKLLAGLEVLKKKHSVIDAVRGKGLFCAIDFVPKALKGTAATKYMYLLKDEGVLSKTAHEHTVRMSPPLIISDEDIKDALKRMELAFKKLDKLIK